MADELGSIRIKVEPDERKFEEAGRKAGNAQASNANVGAGGGGGSPVVSGAVGGRAAAGGLRSLLPAAAAVGVIAVQLKVLTASLGVIQRSLDFASDLNRRLGGVSGTFAELSAQQDLRQLRRDFLTAQRLGEPATDFAQTAENLRDIAQAIRTLVERVGLEFAGTVSDAVGTIANPLLVYLANQDNVLGKILKTIQDFSATENVNLNELIIEDLKRLSGQSPLDPSAVPTDDQIF